MPDLVKIYEDALLHEDFSKMQEIISELNSIAPSKKSYFRHLYERIGNDLFDKSVELPNYDLEAFDLSIELSKTRITVPQKVPSSTFEDNFEHLLIQFCGNSQHILPSLKSHFLLALENGTLVKADLLFLTSDNCYQHPLIQLLLLANADLNPQKEKLSDFLEKCNTDPTMHEKRYLCVLMIVPHLTFNDKENQLVKDLINYFSRSWGVSLLKCEEVTNKDYDRVSIDGEYFEEIENVCSKVFNNRDISFEEERMIKKFFPENATVIDYKLLKGGFSGAKVAEVQPNKTMGGKPARFVIKFGRKDSDRKLKREKKAFNNYVSDYAMQSYHADYDETSQYEAIKYTYASRDNKKTSYPFAQLINRYNLGKEIPYQLPDVIVQLTKCEPFEVWSAMPQNEFAYVRDLYVRYLSEEGILLNLSRIENISLGDVKSSELWINYERIKNVKLQVKKKACHGDLHTENLFKDDDGVFLIDFGYTDMAHAVLDHATLEASIKFKHIPFYVDIHDLEQYEEKLCHVGTFDPSFELDFVSRPNLQELFKLILLIRRDAKQHLRNHHDATEYFISLFMISMRQIQYGDLNQRYALRSATVLSRYVISNLD